MKRIYLLIIFGILIICHGCEDIFELERGSVVFYTNAHGIINLNPELVEIEVSIDDKVIGILKEAYTSSGLPACKKSSNTIYHKTKPGTYNYQAVFNIKSDTEWFGEVKVQDDSCSYIYLEVLKK